MTLQRALLLTCAAALVSGNSARLFGQAETAKLAQEDPAKTNQNLNMRAYIELLRSDLKKQKMVVVSDVMQLTPEEAAKFWPIYKDYDAELTKLGDQRLALIKKYADAYETLSDSDAHQLALAVFDLESKRTDLKKKYFTKLEGSLSSKTGARFFQVENQLLMLLDLQVASILPVVK